MDSLLASRLTQRHRLDLQRVAGLAARQTRQVLRRADPAAITEWWTAGADAQVERIVQLGHGQAALLTMRYLQEHAAANDAEVDPLPAVLDLDKVRGSLFTVGIGGFFNELRRTKSTVRARRTMTVAVVGNVQRFVLDGDRDTVLGTLQAGR